MDVLLVVRDIIPVLQSETSTKILNAISPLLTYVEKERRMSICDLLIALAENDPSMLITVISFIHFTCIMFSSFL